MMKLGAIQKFSDHMLYHSMDKKHMDNYIKQGLARNLAEEIMKHEDCSKIIVKRDFDTTHALASSTDYMIEVVLLTVDEAKEYRELQKLKEMLKYTVK